MPKTCRANLLPSIIPTLLAICFAASGCHCLGPRVPPVSRELTMASMPPYVINPPDILLVNAIRLVPLPPYRIGPFDVVFINVTQTLPEEPISNLYTVEPEGTVNLGFSYGAVAIVDLTLEQAKEALSKHLLKRLRPGFQVNLSVAQYRAMQQIAGPHLVRQDGTISLGTYGSVPVSGLTLEEARERIEVYLTAFILKPEISLDVGGYNSKVYYVITDGAGLGEQVYRLPVTGYETVLDALSQIYGLPQVASKSRIWVARPNEPGDCHDLIMPVDWCAITKRARTETNYQIYPGDRIYVQADPLITLNNYLGLITAPMERVFGITLLGNTVVQQLHGGVHPSGTGVP